MRVPVVQEERTGCAITSVAFLVGLSRSPRLEAKPSPATSDRFWRRQAEMVSRPQGNLERLGDPFTDL
jgi:hypothetical protein